MPVQPVRRVPAAQAPPRRRDWPRDRRSQILKIALVTRLLAVIATASSSVVRLTVASRASAVLFVRRLRLPAWRPDAWILRISSVISQTHPVIRQIAARTLRSASAATIFTFACGVVVGGLAMWLSGPSRHVNVESSASQQAPLQVPRAEASPVAPVATAPDNPPVGQNTDAETEPPTGGAGRAPRFRGSLVVNSRPSGARVFVNGQSVGETPLVLKNQLAGSRAVRVALDGYEPWSAAVQVVTDTETRLSPVLKAQSAATQP